MANTASVWLVVFLAIAAANYPFLSQRVMGVFALQQPKSFGVRVLELVVLYLMSGGVGLLLEKRAGQIAPQNWEFYAITGTLFLTFAFPGFVYRYLLKRNA